jgi:hypothetical protein
MELPTRQADGSIPSVDELYARAVAAHPDHDWQPAERSALRTESKLEVLRSQRLVDLIEDTKRRTHKNNASILAFVTVTARRDHSVVLYPPIQHWLASA